MGALFFRNHLEEEEGEVNSEEEEGQDEEYEDGVEELINPLTPSQSISAERGDEATWSTATRYRGVSGSGRHWGANIHVNNDCIFAGEFGTEIEAARAYDSASRAFHGTAFLRNFLVTHMTVHETQFQSMFPTKQAILDLLRDGVYEIKLIEFVRNLLSIPDDCGARHLLRMPDDNDTTHEFIIEMFHKVLSSSDVDNRSILTLPENAVQHLPQLDSASVELPLEFTDTFGKTWVFLYGYSQSARSYVFTTGWHGFVDELFLLDDDSVVFYRCMRLENSTRNHSYLIAFNYSFQRMLNATCGAPTKSGEDIDRPSGSGEKEGNSKELMDLKETEKKKKL